MSQSYFVKKVFFAEKIYVIFITLRMDFAIINTLSQSFHHVVQKHCSKKDKGVLAV